MPYITADDYRMVEHLIDPPAPTNTAELQSLEQQIYSLNGQIRSRSGVASDPEWRELITLHARLLSVYHIAGGSRL